MISASEARNLFTKKSIAKYVEKKPVTSFFRSFFKVEEGTSKYVSIEVGETLEK